MKTTKDNLYLSYILTLRGTKNTFEKEKRNETQWGRILMVHISDAYVYFSSLFQIYYFMIISE